MQKADGFVVPELQGVYRAIRERRDVRSGFLQEPMPDDLLLKLLQAAHYAPSVGLMQPWRFILIRRMEIRREVHEIFQRANQAALSSYDPDRAAKYAKLKLEGILDAPQNLCVVCNPQDTRGHRLGRRVRRSEPLRPRLQARHAHDARGVSRRGSLTAFHILKDVLSRRAAAP